MEEFPVTTAEALCLGTSLAISGIFYYVYRKKKKTVEKLNVSRPSPKPMCLTKCFLFNTSIR